MVADISVPVEVLERFGVDALMAAGSAEGPARAVARALSSASLRGVDSHGVRLLPHYVRVLRGGRIVGDPVLATTQTAPGAAIVDAGNGFGHYASYHAIDEACALAAVTGIATVGVVNSSHFGAAGCYVLEAAERGFAAFAFCNSDSFVLPHGGTQPFHGTNPLAFATPVKDSEPYLLDMATSVVPWNRIQDYLAKGMPVPPDVAVDVAGRMTTDPRQVAALLPLGGEVYGYKGASLASLMEVLSAVLTGMPHCSRLIAMGGPDLSTPRRLGHLFIVINPEVFVPRAVYDLGMAAYLADLRAAEGRAGQVVMAPGDREWAFRRERRRDGIPLPASLVEEYLSIAKAYGLDGGDFIVNEEAAGT